ncbi:hypothetical protein V1515DRAFT_583194, partial [Lipomyces mesembrius]
MMDEVYQQPEGVGGAKGDYRETGRQRGFADPAPRTASPHIATLGVSLFLLGVGFGPMLFTPISEVYGRKIGVIVPFFISGLFAIGVATANNLRTVLIIRFFQGLFGGAPVYNSGGVLADIWRPEAQGVAL